MAVYPSRHRLPSSRVWVNPCCSAASCSPQVAALSRSEKVEGFCWVGGAAAVALNVVFRSFRRRFRDMMSSPGGALSIVYDKLSSNPGSHDRAVPRARGLPEHGRHDAPEA